ncbi:hypothetical protein K491DRAFT_703271 [Lophiostoma macrostomum CBS 122681]|uniref:Integral membrane protein n=1 Tax=Lophiostoma macrostomum CBS 122681 TaxID=1314788 RepID=A0A6A6TGI6_9PLEO|nr:hypothetical protein K491DRAFT_703271 [Lophiostoma macrostomum CBS 122681]
MNASATIRAEYVRASRINFRPTTIASLPSIPELQARPAQEHRLVDFKPIDHIEHRINCERERYDEEKGPPTTSFMDLDDEVKESFTQRVKKMYTVFPVRDPTYLVAVVFSLGSLDLIINAFFELLPQAHPESMFETQKMLAIPSTTLIGSALFLVAGFLDTFGALNADRGTLETTKSGEGVSTVYKPALLGSKEWAWVPSSQKFKDLLLGNLAFQAGLIVLFGGIIFMISGVTEFPDIIPEDSPFFGLLVFGPQVIHGAMFFIANALLALSEQDSWWKPKLSDADWQGAMLNTVGGFGFMMAGFFMFQGEELASAIAALSGSWAFLVGSLLRWYVVMEFC